MTESGFGDALAGVGRTPDETLERLCEMHGLGLRYISANGRDACVDAESLRQAFATAPLSDERDARITELEALLSQMRASVEALPRLAPEMDGCECCDMYLDMAVDEAGEYLRRDAVLALLIHHAAGVPKSKENLPPSSYGTP